MSAATIANPAIVTPTPTPAAAPELRPEDELCGGVVEAGTLVAAVDDICDDVVVVDEEALVLDAESRIYDPEISCCGGRALKVCRLGSSHVLLPFTKQHAHSLVALLYTTSSPPRSAIVRAERDVSYSD